MHDVSLYLLELLENSIRAEATHISVGFHADHAGDILRITVEDDGRGLGTAPQEVLDPFYTTKKDKKTGLGLSLLRAEAEATGGSLLLGPSSMGRGVRVEVEMTLGHVDRPPIGDVFKTINVMAVTNPDITFSISLTGDEFDPPIINAALHAARDPLKRAIDHLDGVTVAETRAENGARRSTA